MRFRENNLLDEYSIIGNIKRPILGGGSFSTIGIFILEAVAFLGLMMQQANPTGALLMWGIGGAASILILYIPHTLKYRETSGNVYIDSQTHIADDDEFEFFTIKHIQTMVEPAEPFPFAEHCYTTDELTDSLTHLGSKSILDEKEIHQKIDSEIDALKKELAKKEKDSRIPKASSLKRKLRRGK